MLLYFVFFFLFAAYALRTVRAFVIRFWSFFLCAMRAVLEVAVLFAVDAAAVLLTVHVETF